MLNDENGNKKQPERHGTPLAKPTLRTRWMLLQENQKLFLIRPFAVAQVAADVVV